MTSLSIKVPRGGPTPLAVPHCLLIASSWALVGVASCGGGAPHPCHVGCLSALSPWETQNVVGFGAMYGATNVVGILLLGFRTMSFICESTQSWMEAKKMHFIASDGIRLCSTLLASGESVSGYRTKHLEKRHNKRQLSRATRHDRSTGLRGDCTCVFCIWLLVSKQCTERSNNSSRMHNWQSTRSKGLNNFKLNTITASRTRQMAIKQCEKKIDTQKVHSRLDISPRPQCLLSVSVLGWIVCDCR